MSSNQTWVISSRTSAQGWSSLLVKGSTEPAPPMVRIPSRRAQVRSDWSMVPAASGSAAAMSEVPQVQAGGASTVSSWSSQQGMVQVPAAQQSPMAASVVLLSSLWVSSSSRICVLSVSSITVSAAKALTDRERAIQSARSSAKNFLMFFIFSLLTPPPRW